MQRRNAHSGVSVLVHWALQQKGNNGPRGFNVEFSVLLRSSQVDLITSWALGIPFSAVNINSFYLKSVVVPINGFISPEINRLDLQDILHLNPLKRQLGRLFLA